MSEVHNNESLLINVPEYLSLDDESGISTLADCGSCQSTVEECGSSESGSCSSCEGMGCMAGNQGCSESCSESCGSCEKSDQGGCIGGQCGNSEGCGACESCMDCEDYCQTSGEGCYAACQADCQTGCQISSQTTYATLTKISYFYNKSETELIDTKTETESVILYEKYTPSLHIPSYDSSVYELDRIVMDGSDMTTGSTYVLRDFTLKYYFVALKETIAPWSWTSSNGNATDEQTQIAYSAITTKMLTSKFSYLVWNDLVNKVQEVLDASDDTWNSKYATRVKTLMSSSDKTLTATRFNSVRYNIGLRYSTNISEVSTGDAVLGAYFTTMTSSLNRWISNVSA